MLSSALAAVGEMHGYQAQALTFGPFRLVPSERLLTKHGRVVPLGGRALELLIVLTRHANEVLGSQALMAQVWPETHVDEASLRFQMVALRRALGDGQDGARYIKTLTGQGYCFVAPLSFAQSAVPVIAPGPPHNLPMRSARVVGRHDAAGAISAQLRSQRFVTVVGPGGLGKTSVAMLCGQALLGHFGGAVRLVELGPVSDASLVVDAIAAALGVVVRTADPISSITAFLHDCRMLVILDGCEHVIETAATIAERIYAAAPQVHILATSREALRAKGEHVHRLAPLECPPPSTASLTAADALAFPAVQLFVERAAASEPEFTLSDADAPVVASICRRLDGLALAIELAAGRIGAYGVKETARLLDGRFHLLWPGRRTAPHRQQTLAATLDWSHALLSDKERVVLRRLAIFVGPFGRQAAAAVAGGEDIDDACVLDAMAGLVAKSLVAAQLEGPASRFRLLDTTRAYALHKLTASGERPHVARRHAEHVRDVLLVPEPAALRATTDHPPSVDAAQIFNARAALEWSFSETGDTELGISLVVAAAPVFLQLSLLAECHRWAERAIDALDAPSHGTRREMELQAALGQSLMFTRGNQEQVRAAFERSLTIAEAIGSVERQSKLLGWLSLFHMRAGQYHASLDYAERAVAAAERARDARAIAAARSFLGNSLLHVGRNTEAEKELRAALRSPHLSHDGIWTDFGLDHRTLAQLALARVLWLGGRADAAIELALPTVTETATAGHAVTHCTALLYTAWIYLHTGDNARAETLVDAFLDHAERHSLAPYLAVGHGLKGELAIREGRIEPGIEAVQRSLAAMRHDRYAMLTTTLTLGVVAGLLSLGRLDEARAAVEVGITSAELGGDLHAMPELLRLRAEILLCVPDAEAQDGEAELLRSLERARAQAAPAWELRTAMSLARLWSRQGRFAEGGQMLAAAYGRFHEGFGTNDLRAARQLLDGLSNRDAAHDTPTRVA